MMTSKDSIVIADFANTTGDPVFDSTLRQGLSAQLSQTPFLNIISGDQIAQTLRLMEKLPDTRLDADRWRGKSASASTPPSTSKGRLPRSAAST